VSLALSTTVHTWQAALQSASAATKAGYTDWRLPNIKELRSLAAYDRYDPSINLAIFPNTASNRYWSSSPYAYDSNGAWVGNFSGGGDYYGYRNVSYRPVRLVRGGQ